MDLIPDVEMPVEEADPPAPEIPEEVPEISPPEVEEDTDEDMLPETEFKEPLKQEEVFKVKKKVKLMISEDEPPTIQPVQKAQKKKRVMSDKQKEALAKGREKALATRRRNAQLRKEEKELKSKKKQKDLDKLRKEVNGTSIDKLDDDSLQDLQKNAIAEQPKASKKLYTLEDLKEAQEEAIRKGIEGYDTIRKKRKAEKKKKVAKETHDKKVFQDITRATRAPNPDDVWAVCFQ